jgi:CRP-like cAMP-binding protein
VSDYYPDTLDALPLFRRTDPVTSRAAAARAAGAAPTHCRRILDSFGQGPAGQTELARRTGLSVAAVSKRLPQLRRAGEIDATGREVAGGECEYRRAADGR